LQRGKKRGSIHDTRLLLSREDPSKSLRRGGKKWSPDGEEGGKGNWPKGHLWIYEKTLCVYEGRRIGWITRRRRGVVGHFSLESPFYMTPGGKKRVFWISRGKKGTKSLTTKRRNSFRTGLDCTLRERREFLGKEGKVTNSCYLLSLKLLQHFGEGREDNVHNISKWKGEKRI